MAMVTGYEHHVAAVNLPDPDDRHVVAAGIAAGATLILTWNLRHFPAKELKKFGLAGETPDIFLSDLYDKIPELVIGSLAKARRNLKKSNVSAPDFIDILNRQRLASLQCERRGIWAICRGTPQRPLGAAQSAPRVALTSSAGYA